MISLWLDADEMESWVCETKQPGMGLRINSQTVEGRAVAPNTGEVAPKYCASPNRQLCSLRPPPVVQL